ncbi:hypothetical protein SISNIDRAFT_347835 [Sistotremastrum niveocremeum HHB9708]|uniref:Uncharacterized protein n=2 Tax=Sistotremastraceae TaxID=3402574 RepID=A0A164WW51_9AGAM|nr:hypothetical protein SISNIDRAFT_347835 [Sistotremastrum niveocremeum HHB9708]KZT39803.1 hypothetical protein SISSUDRAFT_580962 [Sistotremastrum suecicum HHB10207 ss-3]
MTKLAHVVLSKLGWRADEVWTRRTVSSYEATVRHVLETIDYRGGRCGEQGESDGNQNSTAEETEHVGVSIPFFGASQRLQQGFLFFSLTRYSRPNARPAVHSHPSLVPAVLFPEDLVLIVVGVV